MLTVTSVTQDDPFDASFAVYPFHLNNKMGCMLYVLKKTDEGNINSKLRGIEKSEVPVLIVSSRLMLKSHFLSLITKHLKLLRFYVRTVKVSKFS